MANLDGISFYGEYSLEDYISQNVITFIKYGLLEKGAYYNYSKGQNDYLGNDASKLRAAFVPGRQNYTVYEGVKHDWIWESGVTLSFSSGVAPFSISGIYVNNSFVPNGSQFNGTGYYVDYSRGLVVFNHPIPPTSVIQVPRSDRAVNVYSTDSQLYKDIIKRYLSKDNFNIQESGIDNNNLSDRAYLPCIFVDVTNYTDRPLEIGGRARWVKANITFTCMSTSPEDRKKLSDFCFLLGDKSFKTYRVNDAPKPLSASGTINANAMTWPQLSLIYGDKFATFLGDGFAFKDNSLLPVHQSKVKLTLEIPVYV